MSRATVIPACKPISELVIVALAPHATERVIAMVFYACGCGRRSLMGVNDAPAYVAAFMARSQAVQRGGPPVETL